MLVKKLILKICNKLGYRIEKVNNFPDGEANIVYQHDKNEIDKLTKDLNIFSEKFPNCIGKEAKGDVNWSDVSIIREYLSDLRIKQFHDLINEVEKNGIKFDNSSIIDVGSGTGYLLRLIFSKYANLKLTGYDIYKELNQLASVLCPKANIIEKDVFADFSSLYDIVFCTQTIEHISYPEKVLNKLLKLCNDDGKLILTVPDGRYDTTPSVGIYPNKKGYWGHVNFWSIESWSVFIEKNINGKDFKVGLLANHKILYAIIFN